MSTQSRTGAPNDAFPNQLGERRPADAGGEADAPMAPRPLSPAPPVSGAPRVQVPPAGAFPAPPPPPGVPSASPGAPPAAPSASPEPPPAVPRHGKNDPFAEFEDDLEGESTRIETDHLIAEEATSILHQPPERPYLRVELGKDKDKEFVLNPGETGVGRSIDNDVILTDIAVSRRHLTIVLSDGGLLKIVDLGSGNGSTVNGSRVREAPLNQGDRIELGETTLVVEIPGQQEPTAPQPGAPAFAPGPPVMALGDTTDQTANPVHASGVAVGGALAAPGIPPHAATPIPTDYIAAPKSSAGPFGIPRPWLFAFLGVGGIIVALVGATITALVLRDDGAATGSSASHAAYNAGVQAMESRDWNLAHEQLTIATRENPGDPTAAGHLQEVNRIREDLAAIARAEAALATDPPNAAGALQELASVRAPSRVLPEANVVRARATDAQVAALRADALEAIQGGHPDEARQNLALLASFAENEVESAQAAVTDVTAALGGPGGTQVASAGSTTRRGTTRTPSVRTPSVGMSPSPMGRSTGSSRSMSSRGSNSPLGRARNEILALFRAGDFRAAATLAANRSNDMDSSDDQRALLDLRRKITEFEQANTAANRPNATTTQMAAAIRLEGNVVGVDVTHTNRLKRRLVSDYLEQAQGQMRRDPVAACRNVNSALRIDGRNRSAASLMRQCEERARRMMTEAQGVQNRDPSRARRIYGQVEHMLPEGNATRRAAYQAKNNIRVRRTRDEDE